MVDFVVIGTICNEKGEVADTGLTDDEITSLMKNPSVTAKAYTRSADGWFPYESPNDDKRRKYFFSLHYVNDVNYNDRVTYVGLRVGVKNLLERLKDGFNSLAQVKWQLEKEIFIGINDFFLRGDITDLFSAGLFRQISPLHKYWSEIIYGSTDGHVPLIKLDGITVGGRIDLSFSEVKIEGLREPNAYLAEGSSFYDTKVIDHYVCHYPFRHSFELSDVSDEQKLAYLANKCSPYEKRDGFWNSIWQRKEDCIPMYLDSYNIGLLLPVNVYGYIGLIRILHREQGEFTTQDIADRINMYKDQIIGSDACGLAGEGPDRIDETNGSVELAEVETWMAMLSNAGLLASNAAGHYSIPDRYLS